MMTELLIAMGLIAGVVAAHEIGFWLGSLTRSVDERDLMLVLHRPVEPATQSGHERFRIAAVQTNRDPHFVGRKSLM